MKIQKWAINIPVQPPLMNINILSKRNWYQFAGTLTFLTKTQTKNNYFLPGVLFENPIKHIQGFKQRSRFTWI